MTMTGAGEIGVAASEPALAAADRYPMPGLDFAFEAEVLLGPIEELGVIDGMRRRIVPIAGGTVAGPRFNGMVLAGGADWQGVRPADGLTRVYARYWLKADDGTAIGVENTGIRRAPSAVMTRLMAGEPVLPHEYYFRAIPFFEVGEGPHQWMNETMFVCVGARKPDRAIIRVYSIS